MKLATRLVKAEQRAEARTGSSTLPQLDAVALAVRAGIQPDHWQAQVLTSSAARLLLNCCRQSGKSTTTSVLAVHTALYAAGSLILAMSPSLRQSSELFRKMLDVYKALGRPISPDAETALSLELVNDSRIVSLPGSEATIRGFSKVALLIIDEAARVPDALYQAVRPMLAVNGGRLVVMSTPWGQRGFFHKEWTNGNGWERIEVPAVQCPRISPAFLAEERTALGELRFASEYECRFVANEGQVFAYEDIAAMTDPAVKPLFGGRSWLSTY